MLHQDPGKGVAREGDGQHFSHVAAAGRRQGANALTASFRTPAAFWKRTTWNLYGILFAVKKGFNSPLELCLCRGEKSRGTPIAIPLLRQPS